jgi:hypothetical protein
MTLRIIQPRNLVTDKYIKKIRRNLKTPVKTSRTLHLSEPYDSRSTTQTTTRGTVLTTGTFRKESTYAPLDAYQPGTEEVKAKGSHHRAFAPG